MIESRQNKWVKDIRGLRRSKGPRRLLEGPHLVGEALDVGLDLETVLMTPEFLAGGLGRRLADRLPRPPLTLTAKRFDELCDADSPRGVMAVAGPADLDLDSALDKVLREPSSGPDAPLLVFADGIQDPGNLGALARVAEAAGASALICGPGCCRTSHPRALRASAGSLLRLPQAATVTVDELDAAWERQAAGRAVHWGTLDPRGGGSVYDQDWQGAFVLVVGAEGPGVSQAAAERATVRLTIPMVGAVESLNATVSAAVVLFERARALRVTP